MHLNSRVSADSLVEVMLPEPFSSRVAVKVNAATPRFRDCSNEGQLPVLNPCILNTTYDITVTDEDQPVGAMRLFPFSWTYFIYQTLGAMHLNSRVSGDSLVEVMLP